MNMEDNSCWVYELSALDYICNLFPNGILAGHPCPMDTFSSSI